MQLLQAYQSAEAAQGTGGADIGLLRFFLPALVSRRRSLLLISDALSSALKAFVGILAHALYGLGDRCTEARQSESCEEHYADYQQDNIYYRRAYLARHFGKQSADERTERARTRECVIISPRVFI